MPLSAEQRKAREGKLTASAVGALMAGDSLKIMNLWRKMVGDPGYIEDDLSDVWPVALGDVSEQLNLDWYQRRTGNKAIRRGEVVVHPRVEWAAATLDGWDEKLLCPIECKHVSGRVPFDKIIERYLAQTHWQMDATGADRCILSVIEGANEPRRETIYRDKHFGAELWDRAWRFMGHVSALTMPIILPPADMPALAIRSIDMTGNNHWADFAGRWLESLVAAKDHEVAERGLKGMVPSDAQSAFGHGVSVLRDRAGRLRANKEISPLKKAA